MKVDDYGRFFADARLLKAHMFPLQLDTIREADIVRCMDECHKADLIALYEVKGKGYLQIKDFRQRLDRAKEKYPPPTCQRTANELPTNDPPRIETNPETKPNPEVEVSRAPEILITGQSLDKAQEILNSQAWLESVAMKSRKSLQFCKYKLVYFLNRESLKSDFDKKSLGEIKDHFVNWIQKQSEETTNTKKNRAHPGLGQ
jgi:hypothetical protein